MKKEFKFLTTVVSILIVSMLILAGCMQVLSQNDSEPKDYDMDIVSQTVAESTPEVITKDPPVSYNDMQKKFSDMSEISEDGRSITVISEDYLNNYWQENKNKQAALTSAEVLYIIQDSIRIYSEYDSLTVISNPTLESMHRRLIVRYPLMNGTLTGFPLDMQTIDTNYVNVCQSIHALIVYRLAALSSPDAFIFADEALQAFGSLSDFKSTYIQSIFYIPKDAPTKDYSTLARFICGNIVDYEKIGIFDISYYGDTRVIHYSCGTSSAVFPTAEMESSQANRVVAIEDRTEAADAALEPFWQDDNFVYSFPCIQSQYVFAIMGDGREMLLVDALKLGYITPQEFPNFNFLYWRSVKRAENVQTGTPYFKATATYTDKKRTDGIYPYANFIPDTIALVKYYNDIMSNDVYVTDKGTYEVPSFIEMFESYDGPWFEKNSLILVVIEADSDVLPKVSSIIVNGSQVDVKFDPESLGSKQDQVYTVFIDTNKLNIERINIICE